MSTSELLKRQIQKDFEKLIECSNDLWRLRISYDCAIDDLEATLQDAGIIEEPLPEQTETQRSEEEL